MRSEPSAPRADLAVWLGSDRCGDKGSLDLRKLSGPRSLATKVAL